jgi:hypothetical protein
VTVIQRFGGELNLNVHFHTLVLDGVFTEGVEERLRFEPTPPPTDEEVGVMLAAIRTRVRRLLRRRGLEADVTPSDVLAEESPTLAGISSASIQGRVALGRRAGARVWRVGEEPDAPWVLSSALGTRISKASTSMRMSRCPARTARGSSSSAATCCARPSARTGSDCWAMAASCSH